MTFTISGLSGYPTTNLQPGNTGSNVLALQSWLVKNGFLTQAQMNSGPGIYGPATTAAVSSLQTALGVNAGANAGFYGPLTIGGIQAELTVLETPTLTAQTLGQTWTIGQAVNFTVPSNTFTDPQNESLTYTAKLAGGAALPSWLSFNGGTRTFTGTVPSTATNLNITLTATDTGGLAATENFAATLAELTPSLSIVSPGSIPADGNNHAIEVSGSNFVRGDTLTFTDPQGDLFSSNVTKLTFVSNNEIDYQINDDSDAGNWTVRVNSPNDTRQSNLGSFSVASAAPPNMLNSLAAPTLAGEVASISQQYQSIGFYLGRPAASPFSITNAGEISQSGRSIVSIFESGQSFDDPSYFTTTQADTDAVAAISAALPLNQTHGSAIYFAVDAEDSALSTTNVSAIDNYFGRLSADFNNLGWLITNIGPLAAANPYQIGIYAGGGVLSSVQSEGLSNITYYWFDSHLGGSFSGAQITRDVNADTSVSGVTVPVDTNSTSVLNFGQWTPPVHTLSLSSVSPNDYSADGSDYEMQIIGSNFQSGDTLTFTDTHGVSHPSNLAKLTFVSSNEIDYRINDDSDAGMWTVQVNSPDGTSQSNLGSFKVSLFSGDAIVAGGVVTQGFGATDTWANIDISNPMKVPAGDGGDILTHTGIDIAGFLGERINAFADGVVVLADSDSALGNYILIDDIANAQHPENQAVAGGQDFYTLYLHMENHAHDESGALLDTGDQILTGQEIGQIGDTGESGGPHVHLEARLFSTLLHPTNAWDLPTGRNIYLLGALSPDQMYDGGHGYLNIDELLSDYPNGVLALAPVGDTACYCRDTLIMADDGEVLVQDLNIGDRVITMSGATRPIKWIGRRSYNGRFALGKKDILPICFKAGSLNECVPRRDLWISPHHAMYLEGILIEAKDLINGVSIVQASKIEQVEYFHIELDTHDVIIAEGALSETFIDDDSRGMFHNAHEYRVRYPDAPFSPARYCAPRREDGYEVEAARAHIEKRAGLRLPMPEVSQAPRGYVDVVNTQLIAGWVQNTDFPEAPVCLDIYAGGELIGQALANRYRQDLHEAGVGSGHHCFEFAPPAGVHVVPNAIEVRRSLDGENIGWSHNLYWSLMQRNPSKSA